ncbi:MAG: threonine synthase [Clostridiaceae bacterium]|nr:threonine synthase [Eubacteriales bacterium]
MIYHSTRSKALTATGLEAVLKGIAPDGGLYMPERFPLLPPEAICGLDALGIAKKVLAAYFDELDAREISAVADTAYIGRFETGDLTPLVRLNDSYALELFRGPTQAFKDVALSVLPHLMAAARKKLNMEKEMLILAATSGDTGKAALSGFCDVPGTRVAVFYPYGGVSAIQRLQMTTQEGRNVAVCAVRGNFDDAQTGVKAIFASEAAQKRLNSLGFTASSANSINIGRLVPQIAYYYKAYSDLVKSGAIPIGAQVDFAVPTGNFGDILAGYFAKRMGLPVGKLICASNSNDVLTEFFRTGRYDRRRAFFKTASPSMDILISSNLERLLYLVCGENTARYMERLKNEGFYDVSADELAALKSEFFPARCGEEEYASAIRRVFVENGYLCDTHTAVAFHALWQYHAAVKSGAPAVVLCTASPFKFPAAVLRALEGDAPEDEFEAIARLERATGVTAPRALTSLKEAPQRHKDVVNLEEMESYILRKAEQTAW